MTIRILPSHHSSRHLNARLLGLLGVVALALLLPARAHAQSCVAPPGTSAVDQYCEQVPGPGGGQGRSGPGGGGGQPVSPGTARSLQHSGPDGAALLGLTSGTSGAPGGQSGSPGGAASGTPNGGGPSRRSAGRGVAGASASGAQAPSSNPFQAIKSAVDTGASAGPVFVWTLLALALLLVGAGWIRFRRRHAAH